VRVKLANEAGAATILSVLEDIEAGRLDPAGMLVIEAGELGAKSKLRAGFEAAKRAAALQTFALDASEAGDFVRERLRALSVSIQPEALEVFLADLALDRDSAAAEADKLALFSADLGRPIEIADIDALSAGAREGDGERAAAKAVAGDVQGALGEARRALSAGASAIQMTRAVERRLRRVLEVRAAVAGGRGVQEAIASLQPPVFRNEQAALAKDVEAWGREGLAGALAAAREAELGLKRAGAADGPVVERLLAGVARRRRG
jgi:DNA polymerase III subunit delta